jgi:hypothetical protein
MIDNTNVYITDTELLRPGEKLAMKEVAKIGQSYIWLG